MKRLLRLAVAAAMVAGLHVPRLAAAVDLSGAWASNEDVCSKVFVRRGRAKQIEFTALSDQYGGGFIVEAVSGENLPAARSRRRRRMATP
jgi:hypothetical protein